MERGFIMKLDKNKIITSLTLLGFCVAVYTVIVCAWVGAEYLLEGAVHMGRVDQFFAVAGAYYLTRDMYRFDRKYGKKFKRGAHEK